MQTFIFSCDRLLWHTCLFCVCRDGLRDCGQSSTRHVSAQEWRLNKGSCGIYPWCQTSLIRKCRAGGNGPVSCQVWTNFRLMSADIGLKLLLSRESEISEDFLVLWRRKWNVSRWTIKVDTFESAVKQFKIYKKLELSFPMGYLLNTGGSAKWSKYGSIWTKNGKLLILLLHV